MNETIALHNPSAPADTLPAFVYRKLRSRIVEVLSEIHWGEIVLVEDGEQTRMGKGGADAPSVMVHVHEPYFFTYLGLGGSVGAGQAYYLGLWDTDDLTDLIRILVRNMDLLDAVEGGLARLSTPLYNYFHRRRENSLQGSRKNISAHYDLGNDFFERMLDPSMMYSAAIYPHPEAGLAEAQFNKLDRICRKLDLRPDDHLVEIGTGWGGFAIHAAKHFGCRVTTTTISREQHDYAQKRIQAEGLSDRIELLFEDYRKLGGTYDKLVSIEMIEAVGADYLDTYINKISELLKPDGQALIQAITIEEHRYEQAVESVDFIKRFIFPGSFIPCLSVIMQSVASSSDLRLTHAEDFGSHYARTLRQWRENIEAHVEDIEAMGYSREFLRMWEFYLCYCEGGFLERSISDQQLIFSKPLNRSEPLLPGID